MFRRILVCTDLSPASDALVECVEGLKPIGIKEIVLAHAVPYADAPLLDEARHTLDRQVRMLTEQGLDVTVDLPAGPAAAMLAEAAEIHDVSVIFIGSHGTGIFKAATIGSVSEDLLHRARRPVLLAHIALLDGGKSSATCGKLFSKILFPTDFYETAERALQYLGVIAKETGAPITLLHVLAEKSSDPAELQKAEEAAQYLLDAKKRRLEGAGALGVTISVVNGTPERQIMDVAQEGRFSLMVMGFGGKPSVKEVLMGSVAHEAARHGTVPILFIPGEV